MERQAGAQRRFGTRRKQQSIAAEIVEPQPVAADRIEQCREAAPRKQFAREQVMALHPGLVSGLPTAIHRLERKPPPVRRPAPHLSPATP